MSFMIRDILKLHTTDRKKQTGSQKIRTNIVYNTDQQDNKVQKLNNNTGNGMSDIEGTNRHQSIYENKVKSISNQTNDLEEDVEEHDILDDDAPCNEKLDENQSTTPKTHQETVLKRRVVFTRKQTWLLEKTYEHRPYLTAWERELLARNVNATPNQIKIWFQNHRYKMKKLMKDVEHDSITNSVTQTKQNLPVEHSYSKTFLNKNKRKPILLGNYSFPISETKERYNNFHCLQSSLQYLYKKQGYEPRVLERYASPFKYSCSSNGCYCYGSPNYSRTANYNDFRHEYSNCSKV